MVQKKFTGRNIRNAAQGDQPPTHPKPTEPQQAPKPRVGMDAGFEVGMFTTISVLQAMEHRFPIPAFLRDTFFSQTEFSDAENLQMDLRKGPRGLAPFILPLEGQVIGRRLPFLRRIVQAPILAPARVITLREIARPFWGETMYDFNSPEQRVANMMADDYRDMDEEISRREEWMCANLMFNGKIQWNVRTNTEVGADWTTIDYGFTNITTLPLPWTDPAADPLEDLTLAQQGMNANGYSGNIAIYGIKAWNALMRNPHVRETFLWPRFGPVNQLGLPEETLTGRAVGVARGPSFTAPIMDNIIYNGGYGEGVAGGGEFHNFVPPDKVLICSSETRHRMVYTQVVQLEQADGRFHSYVRERVPKVECNVNKNLLMQTLTSRPMPLPLDLLSWSVLEGAVPP